MPGLGCRLLVNHYVSRARNASDGQWQRVAWPTPFGFGQTFLASPKAFPYGLVFVERPGSEWSVSPSATSVGRRLLISNDWKVMKVLPRPVCLENGRKSLQNCFDETHRCLRVFVAA